MSEMNGKKSKSNNTKSILSVICYFIICVIVGLAIGMLCKGRFTEVMEQPNGKILVFLHMFMGIVVALYVNIILHEAGHLLMGILTGYKFLSFRIGSIMLIKKNNKFKLCFYTLAGTGGQCLLAPPDWKEEGVPFFWYNAGGVVMNILLAITSAALLFTDSGKGLLGALLLAFLFVSTAIALMNGIPFKSEAVNNDGSNIRAMCSGKRDSYAWWLLMKINEQVNNDVLLNNMPKEWFQISPENEWKNVMKVDHAVFCANRILAEGKYVEFLELSQRLLETDSAMQGIYRWMLKLDNVYCELIGEQKEEVIRCYHDDDVKKLQKSMSRFPSIIRTQYAYHLLAMKDPETAESYRLKFERIAKNYPYKGEILTERKLMDAAEEKYRLMIQ